MHDTYDTLASDLRDAIAAQPQEQQFWLGLIGAPGSGKSTLSGGLLERIGDQAVIIPMDGYHFSRAELDAMPDPTEAHRRRGAPFTFNAERFVRDLTLARDTGVGTFPTFQHGVGDPVEYGIELNRSKHRLVIIEGNYLLLDEEPWCHLVLLFDETWFIQVEIAIIRERLKQRFLANGLPEAAALERVESNDIRNSELIHQQCQNKASRIVIMG